jgi:hypothetical protein
MIFTFQQLIQSKLSLHSKVTLLKTVQESKKPLQKTVLNEDRETFDELDAKNHDKFLSNGSLNTLIAGRERLEELEEEESERKKDKKNELINLFLFGSL